MSSTASTASSASFACSMQCRKSSCTAWVQQEVQDQTGEEFCQPLSVHDHVREHRKCWPDAAHCFKLAVPTLETIVPINLWRCRLTILHALKCMLYMQRRQANLAGLRKHVLAVSVRDGDGTGKGTLGVSTLQMQVDVSQLRQQLFGAPVELQGVFHLQLPPLRPCMQTQSGSVVPTRQSE